MQVGVGMPSMLPGVDKQRLLDWARAADAGPFSTLAAMDRLAFDSLDAIPALALCAGATNRIRLASTAIAAPLRNPAVFAKETATLDVLCGGRLMLGLGVGAHPSDYAAAGLRWEDRRELLARSLHALRAFWTGDTIGPRPARPGGPKLLVAARTQRSFELIAQAADGLAGFAGPPDVFAAHAGAVRAAWEREGRTGQPHLLGAWLYALGEGPAERGREYIRSHFSPEVSEIFAEHMLASPEQVMGFLSAYQAVGCDEVILFPMVSDLEQLELLGGLVMTAFAPAATATMGPPGDIPMDWPADEAFVEAVARAPGSMAEAIAASVGCDPGLAHPRLAMLAGRGQLQLRDIGARIVFFPPQGLPRRDAGEPGPPPLPTAGPPDKALAAAVARSPGAMAEEIAAALGCPSALAHPRLALLAARGELRSRDIGSRVVYFPTDGRAGGDPADR
ncbi:MAG: LLM class flavin-dependent oxidoreductase [Solirubrobacterales bacterium]|nr:LLM class flavin-dependent oxidoreductase [Solirubrobacterales bacterium]